MHYNFQFDDQAITNPSQLKHSLKLVLYTYLTTSPQMSFRPTGRASGTRFSSGTPTPTTRAATNKTTPVSQRRAPRRMASSPMKPLTSSSSPARKSPRPSSLRDVDSAAAAADDDGGGRALNGDDDDTRGNVSHSTTPNDVHANDTPSNANKTKMNDLLSYLDEVEADLSLSMPATDFQIPFDDDFGDDENSHAASNTTRGGDVPATTDGNGEEDVYMPKFAQSSPAAPNEARLYTYVDDDNGASPPPTSSSHRRSATGAPQDSGTATPMNANASARYAPRAVVNRNGRGSGTPAVVVSAVASDSTSERSNCGGGGGGDSDADHVAVSVFGEIRQRMMEMKVRLEEKDRQLQVVQSHVQRGKEERVTAVAAAEAAAAQRLTTQRRELEATIRRHLAFIDQLVRDKQDLAAKCEQLTQQVGDVEARFEARAAQAKADEVAALQRAKVAWQAGERQKREAWQTAKTKAIKQSTIKGLEPEIQRLMQSHKTAQREAADAHVQAVAACKETGDAHTRQRIDELRRELTVQYDATMVEERARGDERVRAVIERYDGMLVDERQKVAAAAAEAEARCVADRAADGDVMQRAHDERQDELEAQERKHAAKVREVEVAARLERDEWQTFMMKKLEKQLDDERAALQQQLTRERNAELDRVISKLSSDTAAAQRDAAAEHASQLNALRDEHAQTVEHERRRNAELRDDAACGREQQQQVAFLIKAAAANEEALSAARSERDDAVARLRTTERGVDAAVADRVAAVTDELDAARRREQQHAGDTDALHARVRAAMAKKDEQLTSLRRRCQAQEARIAATAGMLDQQRSELFEHLRH
jgi:5-azacytidine-induced protein 1